MQNPAFDADVAAIDELMVLMAAKVEESVLKAKSCAQDAGCCPLQDR